MAETCDRTITDSGLRLRICKKAEIREHRYIRWSFRIVDHEFMEKLSGIWNLNTTSGWSLQEPTEDSPSSRSIFNSSSGSQVPLSISIYKLLQQYCELIWDNTDSSSRVDFKQLLPIMDNNDDGAALFHGEYRPLPQEFMAVGVFGIALFSTILFASIFLMAKRSKAMLNRLFFASLISMATFELPRYFLLSLETSYHSTTGYAMHMISGVFYFICLAIIGITFANILELGSLSMMIYSKRGLSFSIFLHSLVDISAAIICLKSRTLASFFGSRFYLFYMIFDILQNLVYSLVLVIFGIRLIVR